VHRFSKGLAAKAELQQDIIRIIKSGKAEQQQQQQQQQGEQSSVFRYMLDARRQTQTTVSCFPYLLLCMRYFLSGWCQRHGCAT
jgi:hypothetical protein